MIAAPAAGAIAMMSGNSAKATACVLDCLSTPLELAIVIAYVVLGVACFAGIAWYFSKQ